MKPSSTEFIQQGKNPVKQYFPNYTLPSREKSLMSIALINEHKYIHGTLFLQHFGVMYKLKCLLVQSLDLGRRQHHSFPFYGFVFNQNCGFSFQMGTIVPLVTSQGESALIPPLCMRTVFLALLQLCNLPSPLHLHQKLQEIRQPCKWSLKL